MSPHTVIDGGEPCADVALVGQGASTEADHPGHVACFAGDVAADESFIALVIFPSTAASQAGQADALLKTAEAAIHNAQGFISGRLFLSEDGESVVSLVEWRDRESFTRFRQSEFGRMTAQVAGELRPRPYWLKSYASLGRE